MSTAAEPVKVLQLRHVSLSIGEGSDRTDALADISLDVAPGELIAVTGRSGSGKSSLLNAAGGLVPVTSGSVHVAGRALSKMSARDRARARRQTIGYVFQDLNLLPTLTAIENVSLPLELDGINVGRAREQAIASLEAVGAGELANRFPPEMSGGQRQRVAIARGLVGQRQLLLADEPTGALDDVTAEDVMRLLRRQCEQGAATLIVTHDLGLASWADRVIRLRDGRIHSVSKRPTAPIGIR